MIKNLFPKIQQASEPMIRKIKHGRSPDEEYWKSREKDISISHKKQFHINDEEKLLQMIERRLEYEKNPFKKRVGKPGKGFSM